MGSLNNALPFATGGMLGGQASSLASGKKPGTPPMPDYLGAAQEQGNQNRQSALYSAQISNPNVNTPYGSQQVSWNGNIPTVNQSLSPEQQRLYNLQTGNQAALGGVAQNAINTNAGTLGGPLDLSKVPNMPISPGTTASQAMLERIQPQIEHMDVLNQSNLANQGITQGSEAYDNAMRLHNQSNNDLMLQAAAAGIPYDLQANQQGYNQAVTNQTLPLNQILAMQTGSQAQVPSFQSYQGQTAAPAPTFAAQQAYGNQANNVYNQQMGQYNNMLGGLFGLGSTALMFA